MILIIITINLTIGQHQKFKYIEEKIKQSHLNIDIPI